MAKQRTAHAYELELKKMIEARTNKKCNPWLMPQIRATAYNQVMLDKMQQELTKGDNLISSMNGSVGQQKNEVNPLLAQYDKMQRTLLMQLEALGLNYNSKIASGDDNEKGKRDKLKEVLSDISGID